MVRRQSSRRVVEDRAERRIDCRVVDQNIDAPEFGDDIGDCLTVAIIVRHIELVGMDRRTLISDFTGNSLERLDITFEEYHDGPFRRHFAGYGAAKSLTGAADKADLAVK